MSSVEVLKDDEDGLFCLKSAPGTCCPDMNEKQSIDKIGVCLGCGKVYDFKKLKEALLALEKQEKKLNGDGGINNGWKSKLLGFSKRKKFS